MYMIDTCAWCGTTVSIPHWGGGTPCQCSKAIEGRKKVAEAKKVADKREREQRKRDWERKQESLYRSKPWLLP